MDPFEQLWGPPKATGAGPLTMNLIKGFEGYAPVAKWDVRQHSGGYGSRAQPGERFTPEIAEQRLNQEVAPINSWLDKNVKVPLKPEQRAAFSSFGYNLGVDDLEKLLPDINRGDWSTVGNRMLSFNKAGGEVNRGLVSRRQKEAALVMGGQMPERQMPMMPQQRQQGPLTSAMGGMSNSMVPGIFGGGDEPGYFGKLLADPTFLTGASVLGAGLSGQDFGTALARGTQGAAAQSDMFDKRRKRVAWEKMFGPGGQPNMESPMLKNVPPDLLPIIQHMGPEQGMQLLGQIAMKRHTGKQVGTAAPGSTMYDMETGKPLFQAPSESPYNKELAQEQAKADVKTSEHAKAGQQMLDLTERVKQLAGAPGTPARQTFDDATGPMQGTDWYQGMKGFINSKAETPVVYNQLQQNLGTIKLLATRAYLSGQGQVTEAERAAVAEAIGRVEHAPSGEAGLQALDNLQQIVQQVFMKPPTGPAGPQGGLLPPPGAVPGAAPPDMAMPGVAVQGGPPGMQPPPQMQQPGPQSSPPPQQPRITDGKGNMLELDPTGSRWVPVQASQQGPQGQPVPAGPPQFKGAQTGGANADQQRLISNPTPEAVAAFDAFYGPGRAAALIQKSQQPPPGPIAPQGRYGYRGN